MRIIPVLDLLGSQVVRGVAGRRDQYRPLQTRLVEGSDPVSVATAIRSTFGYSQFYVADLDAILTGEPNQSILQALCAARFSLLVDAGIRRSQDAGPIFDIGVEQVVAGLETVESPQELAELVRHYGCGRIVFSLDLRDGKILSNGSPWPSEAFEVAESAIDAGCTELIVLDIARVGTGGGVPTLGLCDQIRRTFPSVTILTGGGVRGVEDLRALDRAGIDGVLIASALHDGSIRQSELSEFGESAAGGL
ncbi:MAG TPA: HisA/HisF-related TIM barrel protein [Planctomycetaceae bacterium]|jgi:phosphoribosylformimino-5-aminoimidazole carboxamide ribotide isomerase|nr:HisA/HisF-related TIM barrel protein [Planctomycetaceae bacterium]